MYTSTEELYIAFKQSRKISTDSRQVFPGSMFFALKGDNFDGNKYAEQALKAGASVAVIDNPAFKSEGTVLVEDVLSSLQQLANMHRRQFNIPVVAITGSNGKTTTKELVNSVLSQIYKVTATKGNLNNHIGVPLTLLQINDETEMAIIEMGANHQGEIEQLCKIAEPTHGLITNIGKAHLGGFGGFEGVIKAKSELYKWLRNNEGEAFIPFENELLVSLSKDMKTVFYGKTPGIFAAGKPRESNGMLVIDWKTPYGIVPVETNLVGSYNFENVMAALCLGAYFNVPVAESRSAICTYFPSNSRSQLLKTSRNSVILDAYNANPSSMQAALENFNKIESECKVLILGDMLELGEESLEEHKAIVNLLHKSGYKHVILVGPVFTEAAGNAFTCFQNSELAAVWLKENPVSGCTILIKGSRGIKMEKALEFV